MVGRPLVVLGLMSGTSADGIDGVLVHVPETPTLTSMQGAFHREHSFTVSQRNAVFALFRPGAASAEDVCRMNFCLGEWFAEAALATLAAAGVAPDEVDLIGSHGQTVMHLPPGSVEPSPPPAFPRREAGSTLQIGEPAVIAERTGITTVADFRVRDVAAGGQGAPLVSYVDALLFRDPHRTRVVLNLGGIANVTVLPAAADAPPAAFDTGPGNMVLDWLAQRVSAGALDCDRDGRLAAGGHVDESLLAELLADPYFEARPPKTTGRERYGAPYAERLWQRAQELSLSDADVLATATALTAESVAHGLRSAGVGGAAGALGAEVIAGGGGTRNPVLMAELGRRLPGQIVTTHSAFGVDSQAKEALSFAVLAAAAIRGQVNTVPACTGARQAVVMGKIVPGQNYGRLMASLFGTSGSP